MFTPAEALPTSSTVRTVKLYSIPFVSPVTVALSVPALTVFGRFSPSAVIAPFHRLLEQGTIHTTLP